MIVESKKIFSLIGLCEKTKFDTKFSWNGDRENGYYSFQGYQSTKLMFDSARGVWLLHIFGKPDTFATANSTDYPFGTVTWEVQNDVCQVGFGIRLKLDLSV